MKMRTHLLIIVGLTLITMETQAQSNLTFKNDSQIALAGYDVVNYFTEYAAIKGSSSFAAEHNGANYYFATAEHREMFKAEPNKYLPEYGGYCAFAMGMKNATVPSNPETFKIYNGKLYVFFNDLYEGQKFNTIIPWNGDEANTKKMADSNWTAMQ
jgi:YHS domain-containing protein